MAGRAYSYDANGNLVNDQVKQLDWDSANRLASVARGGKTTAFAYGPDGSRATKTTDYTGVSVTTNYYGAEAEEKAGTFTRFPHSDVMVESTGNVHAIKFMHRDHLASIRLVTKAGGTIQEANRYAAFGEPKVVSSLSKGYIGERQDPASIISTPAIMTRRSAGLSALMIGTRRFPASARIGMPMPPMIR